jgi:hypothetical protein
MHAGPPAPAHAPSADADATAKPAPFHTDTDPGDLVFHDRSDCPYAQEIRRNGNDEPGTDGRRQRDWCARHPVSAWQDQQD